MSKTIRLALIGASILALSSPVLAQGQARSDRMSSHRATGGAEYNTAPVFLRERAAAQPEPIYGWSGSTGFDRSSSPYAGGVN